LLPGVAEVALVLDMKVLGGAGKHEQAAVMCMVDRLGRDRFVGMAQHLGDPVRNVGHAVGISRCRAPKIASHRAARTSSTLIGVGRVAPSERRRSRT